MARFYTDENFPAPVTRALRELGHDVLTAFEDGKANQKIGDKAVLSSATELQRAVITLNRRDFAALHAADEKHGGILLLKIESDASGQAGRIQKAVETLPTLRSALIRVHKPNL